jgi:outer membrane biosynthesis protein TonB
MPIRSENVTAPQDRPKDEPKTPAPEPQPQPKPEAPTQPQPEAPTQQTGEPDKAQDKAQPADDGKEEAKAEGRLQSRVIALPRTADGEPDLFGLAVQSSEVTDTDYGNVAKFKVKASKSVLDELEAKAHDALTYRRTVPAEAAASGRA